MLFPFIQLIWSRYSTKSFCFSHVYIFLLKNLDKLIVLYHDILLSSQQLYYIKPYNSYESIYHINISIYASYDIEEELKQIC